ncbi:MAG TPA: hypothetical protein VFI90_19895 [Rubrobacter sp.]|nr:hypothetical protein [Rubrobacter sp.]
MKLSRHAHSTVTARDMGTIGAAFPLSLLASLTEVILMQRP